MPMTAFLLAVAVERAFPQLAFERPLDFQADHAGRNYVVEQGGLIRSFPDRQDAAKTDVFLDLRGRVTTAGNEEGLLGLALAPDFAKSRVCYVNYTAPNPLRTVVSRFRDGKEEVLLSFPQPYANHNGGCLQFGPDGMLYVGTGDGGSAGDPQGNGQRRSSWLGKILRLDVRGGGKYRVPADNPFVGSARPEIWALGLRNPWRFSFDRDTGLLYCADVGQDRIEEVDVIARGGNYGWSLMEGNERFKRGSTAGLRAPIATYGHDQGQSITGGYVYRGARVPALRGAYVYADFVSGKVGQLRYAGGKVTSQGLLVDSHLNISSFGQDARRELYLTAFDGHLYRFTSAR
jgi:glucose/arabinose dehydrogenase